MTGKPPSQWSITANWIQSQVSLNYKDWLAIFYDRVKTVIYYLFSIWVGLAAFLLLFVMYGKYETHSEHISNMALFSLMTALTLIVGGLVWMMDYLLFNREDFGMPFFTHYQLFVKPGKKRYAVITWWARMLFIAPALRALLFFPMMLFGVSAWIEIARLFNPSIQGEFLYRATSWQLAIIWIILLIYCVVRNALLMEVILESDNNESE